MSGRDRPEDKNVLSMASLIVRRHSNSRVDRDRSSDQENETVNNKPVEKLAANLDVPKLAEYKSNRAEMQFIGSDGLNTRNSSESHNLSDWVV